MFAILFSERMDPFYQICASFPTIIFFALLVFSMLYWILAALGMVDIDILDFDVAEPDAGDSLNNLDIMSGILLKLGLNGVPLTIIITLISLVGWVVSFLLVYFIFPWLPEGFVQFAVGIPVFFVAGYFAALITAVLIKPLRPLFLTADQQVEKHLLGKVAIVRTGRVDQAFGEANLADGGAGLILKVRSYEGETFKKGDHVVLLEYTPSENTYKVVSEAEFIGKNQSSV